MPIRLADLTNVPMTMAEVEAMRRGKAIGKGASRLDERKADDHLFRIGLKTYINANKKIEFKKAAA